MVQDITLSYSKPVSSATRLAPSGDASASCGVYRHRFPVLVMAVLWLLGMGCQDATVAAEADRARSAYFENHVRPVLVEHCVGCHGPAKSESDLRLDRLDRATAGGASGAAIVPGDADASLLVQAIRHEGGLEMPPAGRLDDAQIHALVRWISNGAFWPADVSLVEAGPELRSGPITDDERAFWAYQPLVAVTPPAAPPDTPATHSRHPVDRFLAVRLAESGLHMRPAADKRTLLRRATFDLTGLPPTPQDLEQFVNDRSPDAFLRVVDRLLASPAYGERWGRHWLDVVRYADTAGETADYPTPLAYQYRNWVIQAFATDMPYDEFLRNQVAGDMVALRQWQATPAPRSHQALQRYRDTLMATGFLAISRRFGYDVENYHYLTIQDTIDTLGQAVLGLTLGCARCHDHKYDPVATEDYYAWYGIFASTRYSFPGSEEKKRPYDLFAALPPEVAAQRQQAYDAELARIDTALGQLQEAIQGLGATAEDSAQETPDMASRRETLGAELAELTAARDGMVRTGPFERVYGAIEGDNPAHAAVHLRGDHRKLGERVPRRNLEILGGQLVPPTAGSGRWQLAHWLTAPDNPLTARVMVNRIWQYHFGRGLVGTENDFGQRGERPTHPELLDWLARQFIDSGWSVKTLHRVMMTSAAYQQASAYDAVAAEVDPEARLLWRFNPRRLSAEEIRDAMLLVSGGLDRAVGGPHPFPPVESWNFTQHSPYYGVYPTRQRSIYIMQQRLKRHPFLALFDGADPNTSTARRTHTTVPTQALYLMNSPFVHACSDRLAQRLGAATTGDATSDVEARLQLCYQAVLTRPPTSDEINACRQFLSGYRKTWQAEGNSAAGTAAADTAAADTAAADTAAADNAPATTTLAEHAAWSALIRTLLTRNEFLFLD